MKKRLLLLAMTLAVLIIAMTGGCSYNAIDKDTSEGDGRLTLIYEDGLCTIYRDNDTGVQYISQYNRGTCVMVNDDGTPYTGGDAE